MTKLLITVDLDRNPWDDLSLASLNEAKLTRLGLLRNGTSDGSPSVAMLAVDGAGERVVIQTTYKLFAQAARVFAATPSGILLAEEMGW